MSILARSCRPAQLSLALLAATTCWPAFAQDGGVPAANCDPSTLLCSNGSAQQKIASKMGEQLPVGIDTGWLPACPDKTQHNCGKNIQLRTFISFIPLASNQPTYEVTMPATGTMVDARWPAKGVLDLSLAQGKSTDGSFKVAHGLSTSFVLWIDTAVFTGEVAINADMLLPLIPGQQFNYAAVGSTKFAPWAFDKVSVTAAGTDLQSSQLFSIDLLDLGKVINGTDTMKGAFSFNAVTHSTFSYQTTKALLTGASGPITSAAGTATFPGPFLQSVDFLASTEGVVRYAGELELAPVIQIQEIAGIAMTLVLPAMPGLKIPYDSQALVVQSTATPAHLPLPDAAVALSSLDFGSVSPGAQSTRDVVIDNNGELGMLVTKVTSSDPQFTVPSAGMTVDPVANFALPIAYQPVSAGTHSATITIETTDPDQPLLQVAVTGKGQGTAVVDAGSDGSSDSGAQPDAGSDAHAGDASAIVCVPGQQIPCACTGGGAPGAQACKPDGSGYDTCECPDAGASTPAPPEEPEGGCMQSRSGQSGVGALLLLGLAALFRARRAVGR